MEGDSNMRLRSNTRARNEIEGSGDEAGSELYDGDEGISESNKRGLSPKQIYELECRKVEMAERREAREHEFRMAQLQARHGEQQSDYIHHENRLLQQGLGENERLVRAVRDSLPRLEVNKESITKTFCIIESSFRHYRVPDELKAPLLLSIIGSQIPNLFVICSESDLVDYEAIKRAILKEMRLSPAEYHSKFLNLRKNDDTNYLEFANQLTGIFELYLECREIESLQDLKDLIIADQFKAGLKPATLRHVLMQEADSWFKIEKLSRLCENFDISNAVGRPGKTKDYIPENKNLGHKVFNPRKDAEMSPTGNVTKQYGGYGRDRRNMEENDARRYQGTTRTARNLTEGSQRKERRCFECDATDHLRNKCPVLLRRQPKENTMRINRIGTLDDKRGVRANVNVTTCENPWEENKGTKDVRSDSPLEYIDIFSGGKRIKCLIDSGAEICVVRSGIIPEEFIRTIGNITLRHAFEGSVKAKSVIIPLSLERGDDEPIEINAAITDKLCADAIIPPKIINHLKDSDPRRKIIAGLGFRINEAKKSDAVRGEYHTSDAVTTETASDDDERGNEIPEEIEKGRDNSKFLADQRGCPELQEIWSKALLEKEGFFVKDDVLMRQDAMLGNKIEQIVVPKEHRGQILEKAHDEAYGAHLGEKRSLERILKSFFWPQVKKDVKRYVSSCHQCQTRKVINCKDRVPIKAVERTSKPFEIWVTDIIGPLDPPSTKGHKYILTAIDLCTRWPEAWPMKRITAKATCDALLQIFSRTGLPRMICSDGGSNFTSRLTNSFHESLGISPRIASPHHPESIGLCERFNQTLKNMMHHIVVKHNRRWDEYLPLLLFAYRETSNSTLGCSPYQLVYGHLPINPLSLLKELWLGNTTIPTRGVEDTYKYIAELKSRISSVMELANNSSVKQQSIYQEAYNKRAKYKTFNKGDLVMILTPSSSHKLLRHWVGPCKVIEKNREHQYVVETPENVRKTVHANIIRKYVLRVNNLGIIMEHESEDFGNIHYAPQKHGKGKSTEEIVQKCMSTPNLNAEQKQQLERLLMRNKNGFSDFPGLCTQGSHSITLLGNAEPKKIFPYRIPHALRREIGSQINDLLNMGLIEKSTSPWASPIVCVTKRDSDELRLCVDYRWLNKYTVRDKYPMHNATDLLYEVGRANYISILDLTKGYWQITLEENARNLTSFVTHEGQFRWTRMPFGLMNASSTFQRIMNEILSPYKTFSRAYIDDVAIFSETWTEHTQHLDIVLGKLRSCGLMVKLAKCQFGQRQIRYLGHVIGSGTHKPDEMKIEVIQKLRPPETKTELRAALGLLGYYRAYVENFAAIAEPLTALTKKCLPTKIKWTPETDRAFDRLKQALCKLPSLYTPRFNEKFLLFTDASDYAAGACLAQLDEEGTERPIAYFSMKFNKCQKNWATIEKESYAIIAALKKFDTWIFNSEVEIITDHNPLTFLNEKAAPTSKLLRWALALQNFNIKLCYRKGKAHINADSLSRLSTNP